MSYGQIRFEVRGRVAVITLNRPERMNAWTRRMRSELIDAIERCNDDPEVGAIIMTGEGRGFCAGADIEHEFKARLEGRLGTDGDDGGWVSLLRMSKPVVAAVNGASVGVGLTMILPADVIIASDNASFAMAFIKMGLVPELASSYFLVQRAGLGRAAEMMLSGRSYSAREAHEMGLADHLVPHEQLMEKALELATTIAVNPAPQLRWIKQMVTENGSASDLRQVQVLERRLLKQAYASAEHAEAVAAFLEQRAPDFTAAGHPATGPRDSD